MGEGEDINGAAKSGLVVVTGVFDLLHIGHLRFLEGSSTPGAFMCSAPNGTRAGASITSFVDVRGARETRVFRNST